MMDTDIKARSVCQSKNVTVTVFVNKCVLALCAIFSFRVHYVCIQSVTQCIVKQNEIITIYASENNPSINITYRKFIKSYVNIEKTTLTKPTSSAFMNAF